MQLTPPPPEEFASHFTDYIQHASARGNLIAAMPLQIDEMRLALGALTDSQARTRISPEDWSIKEVVSHMIDVERVFSYRFLRVSRNDKTPLPGYQDEDYVRESRADELPLSDLLDEFEFLRRANILAVKNTKESAFSNLGTASGAPISTRALAYILVGHVDHHMTSLQKEYLPLTK